MSVRILFLCIAVALAASGCASFGENYETHYGLANPDNPTIHPDLVDETYAGGTVDAQSAEEYEKKYRDKDILRDTQREPVEIQEQQAQ